MPPAEVLSAPRPARKPRVPLGAWIAMAWLGLLVLLNVVAGLGGLPSPTDPDYAAIGGGPSAAHWLGTDHLGRDEFARLVEGARVSLFVGVTAALVGLSIGVALGLLAGYLRGRVDDAVSLVTDVVLSFPALILVMTLVAVWGASVPILVVGLGLVFLPNFVRLSRAAALAAGNREYVVAARGIGARHARILAVEILPNILSGVLAYAFLIAAIAMVAEGSLSYLGFGVQPPTPTWGSMIAEGRARLRSSPELVLLPAAALFVTVLSFNVVGDWLRGRSGASTVTVAL